MSEWQILEGRTAQRVVSVAVVSNVLSVSQNQYCVGRARRDTARSPCGARSPLYVAIYGNPIWSRMASGELQ